MARIGGAAEREDFFDTLDDNLKFSADHGNVTGHISGLLDIEEYYVLERPAAARAYLHGSNCFHFLANPRLTLNLDVQIAPQIVCFAQAPRRSRLRSIDGRRHGYRFANG